MSTNDDPVRILAAANPVPEATTLAATVGERDALLDHIYRDRSASSGPRRPRRLLLAAVLVALTVSAVPAVALTGELDTLFNFSNKGTADVPEAQKLNTMRVADRLGLQPDSTVRVAQRAGFAFYLVRGHKDRQCFGISSDAGETYETLMCPGSDGQATFPSPSTPLLDLSATVSQEGSTRVYFPRLIGFAADGVAEVGLVDLDGHTHTTPVKGNVYVTTDVGDVPAQALVAFDSRGKVVWRRTVKAPVVPK
jgi:hypothetical protein